MPVLMKIDSLLHAAEKRVIPGSGSDEYKFASFMSVTLSCDHRVIDGKCSCSLGNSMLNPYSIL